MRKRDIDIIETRFFWSGQALPRQPYQEQFNNFDTAPAATKKSTWSNEVLSPFRQWCPSKEQTSTIIQIAWWWTDESQGEGKACPPRDCHRRRIGVRKNEVDPKVKSATPWRLHPRRTGTARLQSEATLQTLNCWTDAEADGPREFQETKSTKVEQLSTASYRPDQHQSQ